MSDMQKKQNFLQGTALLAMATAIVKVIGALYKIPLNAIIGEQGFGYFNTAYDIYNVLLMISTAGLPVAMSRMISQASSLDHYNQVRRIYHTARGIFLALGIAHSNEAAQAQRQVNDITNALLKQNAEKLHMASVETAKEAERGIVDIETLKKTNAELIQTLDDVMKIQSEGREKRIAAEAEMAKMENDLKGKLLEIRGGV